MKLHGRLTEKMTPDGDLSVEMRSGIRLTLEKEYALHSVDLKFERAYPEDFTIKTSKDGKSWETIKTVTGWKNPGSAGNLSSSARVGYSFKLDSEKMHLTFG